MRGGGDGERWRFLEDDAEKVMAATMAGGRSSEMSATGVSALTPPYARSGRSIGSLTGYAAGNDISVGENSRDSVILISIFHAKRYQSECEENRLLSKEDAGLGNLNRSAVGLNHLDGVLEGLTRVARGSAQSLFEAKEDGLFGGKVLLCDG